MSFFVCVSLVLSMPTAPIPSKLSATAEIAHFSKRNHEVAQQLCKERSTVFLDDTFGSSKERAKTGQLSHSCCDVRPRLTGPPVQPEENSG